MGHRDEIKTSIWRNQDIKKYDEGFGGDNKHMKSRHRYEIGTNNKKKYHKIPPILWRGGEGGNIIKQKINWKFIILFNIPLGIE